MIRLNINGVQEAEAKADISSTESPVRDPSSKKVLSALPTKKKKRLRRMTRKSIINDHNFASFGLQATAAGLKVKTKSNITNSSQTNVKKTFKRSQSESKNLNRMNSIKENLQRSEEKKQGSVENNAMPPSGETKVKSLQKMLRLKRKSTIDHLNLTSNKLLGVPKSQKPRDSSAEISISSNTDIMSALGFRNDMNKTHQRMQSFILLSPTLNKQDGSRRGSMISVSNL